MSQANLTTTYRPQNFSQVVGQKFIRQILSRAAAEDKVAPAYLFSGTRGVGKTTIARILAKALNCVQAPVAEPCNECEQCRQITQGTSVDVLEIDGASNTGVEHVRKLREEVGYAPLVSRYRIIIIDEAHMLSKSAFNALLKTLEEPPSRASFVLATTEAHKFPATIVSRCQHYIFKRLTQKDLEEHLGCILDREGIGYEDSAISLLCRKAAGSVRDSMSLLAQVLALSGEKVHTKDVREVLGIAGHEMLIGLFEAFAEQDCLQIHSLLREILDEGLDLGFFLRELTTTWRNIFLLSQSGEKALELLDLPENEARDWLKQSTKFSPTRIHASWQMTLEGQRRILTSVEPALALELLLLNLAYLPDLLPLQQMQTENTKASSEVQRTQHENDAALINNDQERAGKKKVGDFADQDKEDFAEKNREGKEVEEKKDWQGFLNYFRNKVNQEKGLEHLPPLGQIQGEIKGKTLELHCPNKFLAQRLEEKAKFKQLQNLVDDFFEQQMDIQIINTASSRTEDRRQLKEKVLSNPYVQEVIDEFGAQVLEVRPKR
jgi:DNA polymerase-3 subunit gamma/tau